MIMKKKDSFFVPLIISLSIIVPIAVACLMLFPDFFYIDHDSVYLRSLPFFHAVLNGSAAILIFTGYVLIKNKQTKAHKISMLSAFMLSSIFLVSYVVSKISNDPVIFGDVNGDGILSETERLKAGFLRYIYYFILISHIIFSTVILPLALFSIYRGLTGEFIKHKKIVRWTFPIWMYVTMTGVLVYIFMTPYY